VPVAATRKVAVCPTVTFWLTGCVVIEGGKVAPLFLGVLFGPPTKPEHPGKERLPNRIMMENKPSF
jgi:hypothetical protein